MRIKKTVKLANELIRQDTDRYIALFSATLMVSLVLALLIALIITVPKVILTVIAILTVLAGIPYLVFLVDAHRRVLMHEKRDAK